MEDRFRIGKITSPVGLKGEVKVYPYTDYKERFEELNELYIEAEKSTIESVRYKDGMAILKLSAAPDRDAAELLRDKYLFIDRKDSRSLPEDTYYIKDMIGLSIVDENQIKLGTLIDVIQNTGQDLYEVRQEESGKLFYIPAVSAFIVKIDMDTKTIHVKSVTGLMEL